VRYSTTVAELGLSPLSRIGVYPVALTVQSAVDGTELGRLSTLLPYLPDGITGTRVTLLWPLLDRPHRLSGTAPDRAEVFSDDQLARSVSPGGRLDTLLDEVRRAGLPVAEAVKAAHEAGTIVSYDLARVPAVWGALVRSTYDLLILDEAHYAKESGSKRTRSIFGGGDSPPFEAIVARCGAIVALTGTPLPNRPREAYTLARGLCFDSIDWASEDDFDERYNPSAVIEGMRIDGSSYRYTREEVGHHGELQNRLRFHFMTRHEKDMDIRRQLGLLNMPEYDIVLMDETASIRQALKAEKILDLTGRVEDMIDSSDFEVRGHVARVRHQMGIAMAPQAAQYCKMVLDGGEQKLFVFAWHIEVLNILEQELARYGVIRIDGSVSPGRRQRLVDNYRNDPTLRVALGNIQSIGTGTDGLQEVCSHAVGAECSWVPGENIQVVDRLDRGGQKGQVLVDFLVAPSSISERILGSSLRKLEGTNKVLDHKVIVA
jgi:hypothetical protein